MNFQKVPAMYLRSKFTAGSVILLFGVTLSGCDAPIQPENSAISATSVPSVPAQDIIELERIADDAASVASGAATEAP